MPACPASPNRPKLKSVLRIVAVPDMWESAWWWMPMKPTALMLPAIAVRRKAPTKIQAGIGLESM